MGTILLKCNCESRFQDETYGKGIRVHNVSHKAHVAYCTVCSPRQPKIMQITKAMPAIGMKMAQMADPARKPKALR